MVLGVIIVGFPLYLAFVASTHTAQDVVQVPMPMLPGSNFWETYKTALFGGGSGPGSSAPVAHMMSGQLRDGHGHHRVARSPYSLLSAFAIVYFRFPFEGMCFWAHLLDADAARGSADSAPRTRSWPTWACSTATPA